MSKPQYWQHDTDGGTRPRRRVLRAIACLFVLFTLALPGEAPAQSMTVRDYYVRELREDGYQSVRISRTFLGRMRFVGSAPGRRREIIVNPANGAILRDYVRFVGDNGSDRTSGKTAGGSEDDDDDDDYDGDDDYDDDDESDDESDDDDDDDDDDNSGSGSSNSGSDDDDDDDDD